MKGFQILFIFSFLLTGCSTIETGNDVVDAVYNGTSAVLSSKSTADKCQQGHPQDRDNCRKRKQAQVDALKTSVKENSN